MARVFIDGFESGQMDLWDAWVGTPTVIAAPAGMSGSYCLSQGVAASIDKNLPAAGEYYCAFKFKPNTAGAVVIYFKNGTTVLGCLQLAPTTAILKAYAGDTTGTLLASALTALTMNVVYLIEVRYKPHASAGYFQIKVNGSYVINFTGNTTASSVQIDNIRLGLASGVGGALYDDVVVDDANWIGNTSVQAIVPNAIGNTTQFTPSTGNNYACVDERPASAADFVATNTDDLLDTYLASDLAGVIANVKSLQVQAQCIQEGAPTPLNLKLAIRSGGVDYVGGNNAVPTTTAKSVYKLWENNPLDSSVWLDTEINALEIGMKSAA
jgi:hypothetical protein